MNPVPPSRHAGLAALACSLDRLMAQLPAAVDAAEAAPAAGDGAASAGIAPQLAAAAAALALAGEQGLAALVGQYRARLLAAGADPLLPSLAQLLRRVLRTGLARRIGGRPLVAADLLPAWRALVGDAVQGEGEGEGDAAALISLATTCALVLPAAAVSSNDPPDTERALLSLLRAEGPDARRAPALLLAQLLAGVAEALSTSPARLCWQVLHAWLLELADGGEPASTRKILAGLVRALRHRHEPDAQPDLAMLARQALFSLAGSAPHSEAGRQLVQHFDLARQLSPSADFPANELLSPVVAIEPDCQRQLASWLLAREAAGDGLGPADGWQQLAAALTGQPALAAALQSIAARLPVLQADPAAALRLAAAMLCVQAWSEQADGRIEAAQVATLLAQAADADPATSRQALDRLMTAYGHCMPQQWLPNACRDALDALERQLDVAFEQGSRTEAIDEAARQLAAIGGALRLFRRNDLVSQVDQLQSALEHLRVPQPSAETVQAFARDWVLLSEDIGLLGWADAEPPAGAQPDGPVSLGTVFLAEAGWLLARLRDFLQPADGRPPPEAAGDALHAAHTLAGCSATVGLPAMGRLALALEGALEAGIDILQADDALFGEVLDQLDSMLAQFAASGQCSPAQALVDRLAACSRTQAPPTLPADADIQTADADIQTADAPAAAAGNPPADMQAIDASSLADADPAADAGSASTSEPSSEPSPDPASAQAELLAIFREEAADLLPELEQALQRWQRVPEDGAAANVMLRLLHTLKGSARMAGQLALGEEVHRCESEVSAIARLAPAVIAGRLDALQADIDRWGAAWSRGAADAHSQPPAVGPSLPAASAEAGPSGTVAPVHAVRAMLRVRADRIEGFADAAAGLWVGHARISEGVQQQRRGTTDLADNLGRLRGQLRELEIDAESRILSVAAPAGAAGFDPLEMDRYTRLHEITRMIAESVADLADLQRGLSRQLEGLSQASDAQARELRRLQSALQSVRSQPFSTIEPRLRQLLRQAAREACREAVLTIEGGAVDVERSLLDRLTGPLEHLLRNALVHGIEPPAEREALGKPRAGQLVLTVSSSATELQLALADDGRGLDEERIRARAVAVGLLPADAVPDPLQSAALIFQPGFSTASEVTALSGRGIGLDAVSAGLCALGGRIAVDSQPGCGCRFRLSVPLSLATLPVLLVSAGRHRIALPAARLQQLMQLRPGQLVGTAEAPRLRWQDKMLPVLSLRRLLAEPATGEVAGASLPVAILRDGERWLALQADTIDGQRELVVRNPGPQLSRAPGLLGASLLGDGGIVLVIDPFRLQAEAAGRQQAPAPAITDARPLVLVVDDSLTVRRASQRLLERHGFAVALARDGAEALDFLRETQPAVMLLDIEMPRMDGFELLSVLREQARLQALPVVMISSRIADRHRERVRQLGVSAYMGKPYQEDQLISLVSGLCAAQRAAA